MNIPNSIADSIEFPKESNKSSKAVYTIIDREGESSYWLRIGTAFVNRDKSLTVYLNALPINRKLHIRDFVGKKDKIK